MVAEPSDIFRSSDNAFSVDDKGGVEVGRLRAGQRQTSFENGVPVKKRGRLVGYSTLPYICNFLQTVPGRKLGGTRDYVHSHSEYINGPSHFQGRELSTALLFPNTVLWIIGVGAWMIRHGTERHRP